MAIEHRMTPKFVSWALMFALAAGVAVSASAEEAGSRPSSEAKPADAGTRSPDASAAEKNAAPASGEANTEHIDTRITVQPHEPSNKSGKMGSTTNPIQPLKLVNPHRRTFSPSRAAHRMLPNALEAPNGRRLSLPQAEHFESSGVRPPPAIGTAAGVGNASIGLAKPGSNFGREPMFRSTRIAPLGAGAQTLNRGGIGGVSSSHHAIGSTTAGIGGPARTVGGINGTSIRHRR